MRADAAANRARILAVAASAFSADGLDVSLDEVARRAGVGPGTIYRHFPTKTALVDAAIADGVSALARTATELAASARPVEAFYTLVSELITRGAQSHALAERLGRSGIDIGPVIAKPLRQLRAALARLFHRAQRVGGIRREVTIRDLDALLAGAHTLHTHAKGGPHLVALLFESLRLHT